MIKFYAATLKSGLEHNPFSRKKKKKKRCVKLPHSFFPNVQKVLFEFIKKIMGLIYLV